MTAPRVLELFRLPPFANARAAAPLVGEPATLIVENGLNTSVYFKYGKGEPSASNYDLFVDKDSVMAWPIDGGIGILSAVVVYAGAPPAADRLKLCIVRTTEAALPVYRADHFE